MSIKNDKEHNTYNASHIHWFRNDLRLTDQPFIQKIKKCKNFLGIYILDPRQFAHTELGFRKMSLARLQFLRESLFDLQQQMRSLGSDLKVVYGKPEHVLPVLQTLTNATISYQREYATEEVLVENEIMKTVATNLLHGYENGFLVHPAQLPFSLKDVPMGFTSFRNKLEKKIDFTRFEFFESPTILPPTTIGFGRRNFG
jgi:deoxyribodipyrimidine photo-lyase